MVQENYRVKVQVEGANQLKQLNASTIAITSSLGGLGTAAKLATGALAALGAANVARSFLNTSRQLENLETKFKFLFGTVEEGAKAFDEIRSYAATVPFSLQEIAQGAGILAVVSDNAEELRKNLELTGNVAAVSGLDFATAGGQIQRALSAGITASELLRERGVRALLGFKAGVTVSVQETQEAFDRVFGPGGKFGQAAIAMATTFDGLASMVSDKMFTIQGLVMDAGPFDFLKAVVATLDDTLTENFGSIEEAAKAIGEGIVGAAETALVGAGYIMDSMEPVFTLFETSYNNIVKATNSLPGPIKALGVVGFLMLGGKGKLVVVLISSVADAVMEVLATIYRAVGNVIAGLGYLIEKIPGIGDLGTQMREAGKIANEQADVMSNYFYSFGQEVEKAQEEQMSFLEKVESGEIVLGKYGQQLYELVLRLRSKVQELQNVQDEIKGATKEEEDLTKQTKAATVSMENFKKTFEDTFDKAYEKFNPVQEGVDLLISSFETFKRGVGDAFADAILGAKNFAEALRDVGRAIVRQLISGLIQIGLEVFVFDVLRDKLKKVKKEQDNLNAALGIELGLRTALAFFTGGGSLFAGFFEDGGKIPAGKFGVVGESGPELIGGPATVTPMSEPTYTSTTEGDVNINFNISTVDSRGFDELLVSRRALITGIINDGLNRQGRRALA